MRMQKRRGDRTASFLCMCIGGIYMMFNRIFVQALGIVGLLFGAAAFQSNKSKNIVVLKLLNDLFFSFQYLMLGAYTGAVMNWISCFRNLIYTHCTIKEKSNKVWMAVFCVIMLVTGILSWSSPMSLIAIIGKLLTTVSYGMKDAKKIRLLTLPSSIGWLVYDGYYGSMGGVINQILVLCSIGISIVRYDIRREGKRGNS